MMVCMVQMMIFSILVTNKMRRGFTLIEILTVLAVIAILVTMTIGIGLTVDTAIKKSKTETAIKLLVAGLEQYHDFWGEFPLIYKNVTNDYVDENYLLADLVEDVNDSSSNLAASLDGDGTHDDKFASIQGLYFCLNKTPNCRNAIGKLDNSLVSNQNPQGRFLKIDNNVRIYELFYVNDSWKMPLRYTYDSDNDSFPMIESAGPDKIFGDGTGVTPGDDKDISFALDNITSQ